MTATPTSPAGAAVRQPQAPIIIGWILGILACGLLTFSGVMKLVPSPDLEQGFAHLGWPIGLARPLAFLELACVVIYLFPRTAVLGAILLTGYMGGAIATHVRIGEGFLAQSAVGVFLWLGVFLRDARLRALIPWRRPL